MQDGTTVPTEGTTTPASTPPVPPTGDETGDKGKTYTEDEVQRKLQGQGKKLAEYEEKLKKFQEAEAKRKEAELSKDELLAKLKAEADGKEAKIKELTEREGTRLARVSERNEERIKALPKDDRDLVPAGLEPDALSDWLAKFEARIKVKTRSVDGTGGRGSPPSSPDAKKKEHRDSIDKKTKAYFVGDA